MHKQNNKQKRETLTLLCKNLTVSVDLFDKLFSISETAVPQMIRKKALLRRVRVSFLALYEYLREKAQPPTPLHDKPLADVADFFIKENVLAADDKDSFMLLGNMYSAIRWSAPGSSADGDKILKELPDTYAFLTRFIQTQQPTEDKTVE